MRLTWTPSAQRSKPNLHILAIGINNYVDRGWTPPGTTERMKFMPLGLAVKDATTFASDLGRRSSNRILVSSSQPVTD